MKTYFALCDDFAYEFSAGSRTEAKKLCDFWGWELVDDDDPVEIAMLEKQSATLH